MKGMFYWVCKEMEMTLTKHYSGCYRYTRTDNADLFGQIKKVGREWHAEIRYVDGTLKQYAGIWSTRKDAIEEVDFTLMPYSLRQQRLNS